VAESGKGAEPPGNGSGGHCDQAASEEESRRSAS
jgi:hypothetical protein